MEHIYQSVQSQVLVNEIEKGLKHQRVDNIIHNTALILSVIFINEDTTTHLTLTIIWL